MADVAWEFKMLLTHKFKPMNFVVFYQIFETFALPGILPWVFLSMTLQTNVLFRGTDQPDDLITPMLATVLFNILSVASTVGYFLYEMFKRRSNKLIYNR